MHPSWKHGRESTPDEYDILIVQSLRLHRSPMFPPPLAAPQIYALYKELSVYFIL